MANSSGKGKISLRIVVDEEKNKIVLVEAGKDFVEVLFGFLKLQMGTIVRLMKKQSLQSAVGSFHTIYDSVSEMQIDNFFTEACKDMLLYPRSLNDDIFPRLKLNIHDSAEEGGKYFICPGYKDLNLCGGTWSCFSTTKCKCGRKMDMVIEGEGLKDVGECVEDGPLVQCQPSFVITDDMVVRSYSGEVFGKVIKDEGYEKDEHKLSESLLVIGSEEVLTLLHCLFSSDTPLTDAFLLKRSSHNKKKTLAPALKESRDEADSGRLTFKVAVGKRERKIVYIECKEDFVDLLFTFLALSLGFVLDNSGDNMIPGRMVNLFRSFKGLNWEKEKAEKLPWYYIGQKRLLGIKRGDKPGCLMFCVSHTGQLRLLPWRNKYRCRRRQDVNAVNPRCDHIEFQTFYCPDCTGYLKGNAEFRVSDDLRITPLSSSSTSEYLEKLQVSLEDVYTQEMSIGKAEVQTLLSTSFMSSSVLTNALWNLLVKEPKEET